jgi:hypothetical protein
MLGLQAVSEFNVDDRVRKYLAKCEPAVSGQHGHDATFKVAIALVWGFALRRDAALAHLRAYNQRCQPPWSDVELEHKIDSAISVVNREWATNELNTKPPGHLICYGDSKDANQ